MSVSCASLTDSFLYHFMAPGNLLDKQYTNDFDLFDTFDYPRNYEYFIYLRKTVVGSFKDECGKISK